nr:hypothetical protein [Schaalia odontolytica]
MSDLLTPVGLRCRRKALGLTRAELGELIVAPESAIRSWEIGKSRPRDPLAIHMILGNIEDAADDCVAELLKSYNHNFKALGIGPHDLEVHSTQTAYEEHSEWASLLPFSTYQACVGRVFSRLATLDIHIHVVPARPKEHR